MNKVSKDDGGWAFACASEYGHQPGMSLRDWFAGQAMVGLLMQTDKALPAEVFAKEAYEAADALLRARTGDDDE